MSSQYTPAQLSLLLVEKHKKLLNEYKSEHESINRLTLLQEKLDQLRHWRKDGYATESVLEAEKQTKEELSRLKKEVGAAKTSRHIKFLQSKIQEHQEALAYWSVKK
ncbi:Uncharacterised protein [uncultured archaeon]|nr:Uncharacterised protein [uncultured archaeon]